MGDFSDVFALFLASLERMVMLKTLGACGLIHQHSFQTQSQAGLNACVFVCVGLLLRTFRLESAVHLLRFTIEGARNGRTKLRIRAARVWWKKPE